MLGCEQCTIDLYKIVLKNALKCNMDIATIYNLKHSYQSHVLHNYTNPVYNAWLLKLNRYYLGNIESMKLDSKISYIQKEWNF